MLLIEEEPSQKKKIEIMRQIKFCKSFLLASVLPMQLCDSYIDAQTKPLLFLKFLLVLKLWLQNFHGNDADEQFPSRMHILIGETMVTFFDIGEAGSLFFLCFWTTFLSAFFW